MKNHTQVKMTELKYCDICHEKYNKKIIAKYDGKTCMGPWAHMCEIHFNDLGYGLGLGKGQELIYELDIHKSLGICSICRREEFTDEQHNHPCE